MIRRLGMALLLLLFALQAAAADEAQWNSVRPPGWPLALALPADGELELAGLDGITAEELGGRDLQWYQASAAQPGGIYLVSGACLPATTQDQAPPVLAGLEDAYGERLVGELRGEIIAAETLKAGGRQWCTWQVRQPDDGFPEAQHEFMLALTVADGRVVEVWCCYAKPSSPATAGQLARILGGGREA